MAYVHIDDALEPYLDLMLDCIKLRGKDIDATVKKIVEDTKLMDECLEDNFLEFKLHSKKVREEYEKAVIDTLDKSQQVWEKCDELVSSYKPRIDKAAESVNDLTKSIETLNNKLSDHSIYKAERMIELIEKFNAMPATDKALFSKLLQFQEK